MKLHILLIQVTVSLIFSNAAPLALDSTGNTAYINALPSVHRFSTHSDPIVAASLAAPRSNSFEAASPIKPRSFPEKSDIRRRVLRRGNNPLLEHDIAMENLLEDASKAARELGKSHAAGKRLGDRKSSQMEEFRRKYEQIRNSAEGGMDTGELNYLRGTRKSVINSLLDGMDRAYEAGMRG